MAFVNTLKVYSLLNQILSEHNIDLTLKPYVDLNIHKSPNSIGWNRTNRNKLLPIDKVSDYLNENYFKPVDTQGKVFYHYLRELSFLENIIKTNTIRLHNLNKYLINGDDKEYRHFLESFGIDFPKYETQVSKIKNDIFIWSLTVLKNSGRHWKEYANNGAGIGVSLEFTSFNRIDNSFNLIPVKYELDFLTEIQKSQKKNFDRQLEILNYPTFAKFFKQKSYDWESEVRLCLDVCAFNIHNKIQDFFGNQDEYKSEIESILTVYGDEKNEKFILVPLRNLIFTIEIKQIFCTKEQERDVRKMVKGTKIEIVARTNDDIELDAST